jgi:hypothetical protein
MYSMIRLIIVVIVLVAGASACFAEELPQNWSGEYAPCNRHVDLLNPKHMDLKVRMATANAMLAEQFGRAMDFWRSVLDLDWREVNSEDCSIEVVDGTPEVFREVDTCNCVSARSQFPERRAFEGWIAFNPHVKLTEHEMFLVSVHEIGHLLGLSHNANGSSVMFYLGLEDPVSLDAADLNALAERHRLRTGVFERNGLKVAVPSN